MKARKVFLRKTPDGNASIMSFVTIDSRASQMPGEITGRPSRFHVRLHVIKMKTAFRNELSWPNGKGEAVCGDAYRRSLGASVTFSPEVRMFKE